MFNLRLRQAQIALRDGRLDAAYPLVQDRAVRDHRDAQRMALELTDRYVARAQEHLGAGRTDAAESDLDKATSLGGNRPDIALAREQIAKIRQERFDKQHRRDHALWKAKREARGGRYEQGLRALKDLSDHTDSVCALAEDIAMQRDSTEQQSDRVATALDQGELDEAVDLLLGSTEKASDLARRAVGMGLDRVREDVRAGKLDRAMELASRLDRLGVAHSDLDAMRRRLEDCSSAWASMQRHDYRDAWARLKRVATDFPDAVWVSGLIDTLRRVVDDQDVLLASPIAQMGDPLPVTLAEPEPAASPPTAPPTPKRSPESTMILRIDGVGSYLLATAPRVTIGPISSSKRPTVGLVTDPTMAITTVERSDDDYFLHHPSGVAVNDQPGTEHLLRHGDRVQLSRTSRLKFIRPNSASLTALLQIHGVRLPQGDVRQVVLMDRELILADHAAAHVRDASIKQPITLVNKSGVLTSTREAITRQGMPIAVGAALPMDDPIDIGPITITLNRS